VGFLRPQRRRFWFWWDKRRRWHALDVMLADPVTKKSPDYNFLFLIPDLHCVRVENLLE
jgi:hypothetical protein